MCSSDLSGTGKTGTSESAATPATGRTGKAAGSSFRAKRGKTATCRSQTENYKACTATDYAHCGPLRKIPRSKCVHELQQLKQNRPVQGPVSFYKQVIGDIYNIRCLWHLSPMSDSPARVLHIANSLGLGGTEKVMQLFVANLDKNRFLPAVYSPKDGERGSHIRDLGIRSEERRVGKECRL